MRVDGNCLVNRFADTPLLRNSATLLTWIHAEGAEYNMNLFQITSRTAAGQGLQQAFPGFPVKSGVTCIALPEFNAGAT